MRALLMLLLSLWSAPALADPECRSDTFTGERACVYGRGSIGLPGIGNQIITEDGQMVFHRMISAIGGEPIEVDAILFRVDDRRTVMLPAKNATQPTVSCVSFCTWNWTVAAPVSAEVLAELGSAERLIIGFRGEGLTIQEQALKRGGQIFQKFLNDIREHEPAALDAARAEVYLLEGQEKRPYSPPGS